MSIHAVSLALKSKLPTAQKFVLVALSQYANDDGTCWPSQESLARDTSMTDRTVRAHLAKLESAGIISRERRNNKRGQRTSDYITIHRKNIPLGDQPTGNSRPSLPEGDSGESSIEPSVTPDGVTYASVQGDCDEAFDLWNDLAERMGFPVVQSRNAKRKAALKARLRDGGGLDGWLTLLEKIEASPYCRGEINGYRATFDSVSGAAMFTKIMEGNFDDKRKPATNGGKRAAPDLDAQARQRREAIADAIRSEFDEGAGMADDSDGPTGKHGGPEGAGGHAALTDGPDSGPRGQDCSSGGEGMGCGNGPAIDVRSSVQPADGGPENGCEHVPRRTGGPSSGLVARSDQPDDCGASLPHATETGRHSGQGGG